MSEERYRCGEKFYSKGVHILCENAQCDECFDKESGATEQAKTDRIKEQDSEIAELKRYVALLETEVGDLPYSEDTYFELIDRLKKEAKA